MSHIIVVARQIGEWAGPIAGWAVISAIGEWVRTSIFWLQEYAYVFRLVTII